jgi:type I restriction enzyme S subunit
MNAALLLEHYEQIAEAPDAIARLRRFILDLAVRGKLVEQDLNDEPASELLKRIAAEKARLVVAGEIKAGKLNESSRAATSALPLGWVKAPLDAIAACLDFRRKPINGTERDKRIEGKAIDELYPYYGATQQQGWIDDFLFDDELVLLGEDGIPFFDPLRAKAYLISGKTWVNNHAHVFKGILVSNKFLVHALNVFDYTGRVVGATRAKLNQAQAIDIPIDLPPLAEQQRIVAKVDELMALCDQLEIAQTERETGRDKLTLSTFVKLNEPDPETFAADASFALEHLEPFTKRTDQIKQLRETILNLAVRGKLVAQDPNDESVSELLGAVEDARRALPSSGKVKGDKRPILLTHESPPFSIPSSWQWVRMEALCELITKGSSPKWQGINYVDAQTGLLFITSENVGNGRLRKLDELKYVERRFADVEPRSMLRKNDLLMNLVGASIGRTAVYDLDAEANINQAVAILRLIQIEKGPYLAFLLDYLNSPGAIKIMLGSRVVTAQPNISLTDARNFPVPLPPLAEQHRIAAKVDDLMALCDQLEASLAEGEQTRSKLLEAVLHEALEPA